MHSRNGLRHGWQAQKVRVVIQRPARISSRRRTWVVGEKKESQNETTETFFLDIYAYMRHEARALTGWLERSDPQRRSVSSWTRRRRPGSCIRGAHQTRDASESRRSRVLHQKSCMLLAAWGGMFFVAASPVEGVCLASMLLPFLHRFKQPCFCVRE